MVVMNISNPLIFVSLLPRYGCVISSNTLTSIAKESHSTRALPLLSKPSCKKFTVKSWSADRDESSTNNFHSRVFDWATRKQWQGMDGRCTTRIFGLATNRRFVDQTTTSTAVLISADPIPHKTARISHSHFSYAFQVNPGQKIIRLHFNPPPYRGFQGFRDLFTVEVGPFTLLNNFSASLTADALGVKSFSKEFYLNIHENQQLNITFSPESSQSLAFINGIEIISVPASVSYFHGGDIGVHVVGQKSPVYVDHRTALEIIDRLDTKQSSVPSIGDVVVTFPIWETGKADKVKDNTWKIPVDGHGLLAGFEIFKLSIPDNSLASPNPVPTARYSPYHTGQILFSVLGRRNAFAFVAIVIISLVSIIIHKLREYWEADNTKEENNPSTRAERLCRRFSLAEIKLATKNFSDAFLIGKGGFGEVYKGYIDEGQMTVAVKRLKSNSRQGAREFLTEIETLSELRHVNLVSLIGYCNERGEMILVYDYMAGGTLTDHLYKSPRKNNNFPYLTWKERLNICIGAGRGLDYLHAGHGIIHRDVKTANVLLDENFVAKVSDFGLAKHDDISNLESHVSTRVKGTFGYLDPHYFNTGKLTKKTDTYGFGVMLLETLCGRPAVDFGVEEDEHILTMWARDKIRKGEVDQIVASSLREEISPSSLKTFVQVAERCLFDEPKNRPTMFQVVLQLELALEQQDNEQVLLLNEITSASDDIRLSRNDENDSSVSILQPTMSVTVVQNLTPPPNEQTISRVANAGLPSVRRDGRRATTHKSSRLWLWEAFWNRVKPSGRNDTSFTVVQNTAPPPNEQTSSNVVSAQIPDTISSHQNVGHSEIQSTITSHQDFGHGMFPERELNHLRNYYQLRPQ